MSLDIPMRCRKCHHEWPTRFEGPDIVTLVNCPKCQDRGLVLLELDKSGESVSVSFLSQMGGSGDSPYQSTAINLDHPTS